MAYTTWMILLFILICLKIEYSNTFILSYNVGSLANTLGSIISETFYKATEPDELSRAYSLYVTNNYMNIKKAVGTEIFKDLHGSLGHLLGKKINAMKMAVDFAEEEASKYRWDPKLKIDNVQYVNAKEFESAEQRMEYQQLFLQSVVKNESSVHIPTEIFKGDIEVLNGIRWSQSLDKIWTQNWKNDSNLLWQYFASQRGFFRMFPGMKWRKKGVDMYDCRRRPWYVQGSSSAKDVMVLIDTSGSMHGKSLQLTKLAVKHTIDTLGENDYVAVVQFPGAYPKNFKPGVKRDTSPHLLKDEDDRVCFKTFMQATKRNKDRIFKQVDALRAHGIADMTAALELAFNKFLEFSSGRNADNRGADCNRIIIILSDDAATYPKEKIEELRKQDRNLQRIRIFTYAVGSDVHITEALEKMACDFKGSYNRIPAYGAVTHIIHDVSTVLSRPMYLADDKFYVWHNIYLDSLGLGLMTSLTMPLFNRSGNYSLLGLMGTDVTVADMQELLPLEKLGVNGYAFAINLNGYVIFHPGLKSQRGWMRDPPNVDLLEVEFDSTEKRKVRQKIIDSGADSINEPSSMNIRGFIKVIDEIHVYIKNRQYVYASVPYSTFGMAVVMPVEPQFYSTFNEPQRHELKIKEDGSFVVHDKILDKEILLDLSGEYGVQMTSEINFCERYLRNNKSKTNNTTANISKSNNNNSTDSSNEETSNSMDEEDQTSSDEETLESDDEEVSQPTEEPGVTVTEFLRTLVFNQSYCGNGPSYRYHFMKHSLLDLIVTQRHMDWLRKEPTFLELNHSVQSVFITTNGGVTRVFPESESGRYLSFINTRKSSEYTRAFDMDKILLWTPLNLGRPPASGFWFNYSTPLVTIFKTFSIRQYALYSPTLEDYKLGVTGFTLRHHVLQRVLNSSPACNPENSDIICYLVEDAAYILAVNRPQMNLNIGYFLGYVDPVLMNYLLNVSVFKRVKEFDYQASCPKENPFASTASSSHEKTLCYILHRLFSKAGELVNLAVEFIVALINLLIPILSVNAQEATATTSNENESCIKIGYRYYMTGARSSGEINCKTCVRYVHAIPIRDTNSMLIVANPPCEGCPGTAYPPRDPIKDSGPDICDDDATTRYRRRRNQCYDLDPNENTDLCSGSTTLSSWTVFKIFHLLFFLEYIRCGV